MARNSGVSSVGRRKRDDMSVRIGILGSGFVSTIYMPGLRDLREY
jgi:hypothetical protein